MAAARRELGGRVRQHPGSTTALRGLLASLALRSARPWRAMGIEIDLAGCASCATRLCGALWGSGRPPRGGRRRSFVGGNRAMLAAPRIGAARRRALRRSAAPPAAPAERRFTRFSFSIGPCPTWPPRSSGRPTRHSPSHGDISAGPSRSSGRPTRHSPSHGAISAGPSRSSGRPTRHSPPHGDIDDADVAAAAAGRAARLSYGVLAKAWC